MQMRLSLERSTHQAMANNEERIAQCEALPLDRNFDRHAKADFPLNLFDHGSHLGAKPVHFEFTTLEHLRHVDSKFAKATSHTHWRLIRREKRDFVTLDGGAPDVVNIQPNESRGRVANILDLERKL